MKKENSTLLKKIKAYSSLAGSILVMANVADAQVVYTDVDPDVTGTNDGATYNLDLNNDATTDFKYNLNSLGTSNLKMTGSAMGNNAIAGSYNSAYGYKYPYVLDLGSIVGPDLYWNGGGTNTMASMGYYLNPYGNWFDQTDKYMGLRLDLAGDNHYGWVRMDVSQDGHTFVIKDYAYELAAETEINTAVTLPGIKDVANDDVVVFASGKQIYVELKQISEGTITVSNIKGQILGAQKITGSSVVIPMKNEPAGIYFVSIVHNDKVYNQKVTLQ